MCYHLGNFLLSRVLCCMYFVLCKHLFAPPYLLSTFPPLLYVLGGWPSWIPSACISTSHFCVFCLLSFFFFFFFLPIGDEKMKDLRAKGRKWGWIFIPPASSLWACHGWLRPSAEGHHSAGLFLPHNYSLWVSSNFLGPVDLGWK